jgi:hypothetical protein
MNQKFEIIYAPGIKDRVLFAFQVLTLVATLYIIAFFNYYSLVENQTNHTGFNLNLLYYVFGFIIIIVSYLLIKQEKKRWVISIIAILVTILGMGNVRYFQNNNIMLNYDDFIEKGMPAKFNPFHETLLYKSESPDLAYYLKIIKPPNFENVTQEDVGTIEDIPAIIELYNSEGIMLTRIDELDIFLWQVKPQWRKGSVEITNNVYIYFEPDENNYYVVDNRHSIDKNIFRTVNKDENGILFIAEYKNCKMSFSYHNQAVNLRYDSCGENQHFTQEELYKIQEGFYKKFKDEWLDETPTVVKSLQFPRFSYMPELYLKFLLHPETIKTDWKVLEKNQQASCTKKSSK